MTSFCKWVWVAELLALGFWGSRLWHWQVGNRSKTMLLRDRRDGGKKLAEALMALKGTNCVVLGLPRGGVPVAAEVADALGVPMDLLLVRPISACRHPSLGVGTVMCGRLPVVTRDRDMMANTGTSDADFDKACQRVAEEIGREWHFYCGERQPESLFGRNVVVVDDGLSSGDTMRAALRSVRQCRPQLLVMAVPVVPPGTPENFCDDADMIVSVLMPNPFSTVDEFYDNFQPVTDAEVIELLNGPTHAQYTLYHQR
jgi:putative phosphoribosyl transferase